MQHRFVNAWINSYTNGSTSCEIFMKIGAVTSEFERAKIENLPRLGCNLTIIVYLACWRSETDWNIKILILSRLIGNHFCTSSENLVRFG